MNFSANWELRVDPSISKKLKRLPRHDVEAILTAIHFLPVDPFGGDFQKMRGQPNTWRKRIGAYRIFYKLFVAEKIILVFHVERRSSHTY